ncbi:MAG: serine/threonine-protein kinase [Sandaracinaceae bacterium]
MLDDAPTEIGPYRVLRRVATGGMAEIYLGRQRAIEGVDRTIIIKKILPKYADDDEFITMFLDEARLLAALSHPNIAQVFDLGKAVDAYYLTMEYVRGPTLKKMLARARDKNERLPRKEALGIALQIAEALHYVHERRDEVGRPLAIVHRDLNPANVLVSFDGAVKLIDFGIAKAATKVYETRTGVIKGTYGYIAPEQLVGTIAVDRRADVFALGILLYEMVVGTHPFDVSDEPNLVDRILEARYPRPRSVQSDIPRDLDRLISQCLTPHPSGRPETMRTLIDALAGHLGQHGMVPTQVALASAVKQYVPDDEGPQPLRAPATSKRPRPFGADGSGTQKLTLEPSGVGGDTDPGRPVGDARLPWDDATVTFGDDAPLTLEERPEDVAPLLDPDDARTIARPRAPVEPGSEEEAPTRLVSIKDAPSLRRSALSESTFVPPVKAARKKSRLPSIALLVVGAFVAMGLVGLLSFGVVRLLGAGSSSTTSTPTTGTEVAARPGALDLAIVSDPPGATVYVDNQRLDDVTPARVTLPQGTARVWVRVTKDGFEADERAVLSSVGEARFVLRPIH